MIFCAFLPFYIQKTSEQNFIKLFRNEDFYGCNITIWNFQKDPSGVLPYALCACTFLLWNVLPDQRRLRFIYQKQCLPPDARQYYIYSRRYAAPHFLLRCCPAWMCIDWIYTELFKRAGCRIRHSMAAKPPVFQNLLTAGGLPQRYQCHAESDSCRTPVVWYFFKLHVKNVFSDLGRAYFTIY